MSPSAAHQAERSLSSNDGSPQGSHPTASSNIPNEESLSDKAPNKAFVNSLQSFSDDPEMTDNDPSDVKVSATKTEVDANHEETSPLGVPATPPNKDTSTPARNSIPTLSETTPSISSEEELHVSNTASISSPVQMVGGAQVAAAEHKDTNSFDIFDSDDHNTIGGSICHSIHSPDESIFIDNGLVSPKDYSVFPSPNGHIVTPAPNKTASILTPPSSGEKTSAASPCSQEMAPGISPFENKTLFTPPHENHNGDVRTLEQNDLPTLSREDGHNGDIHTRERNDLSTPHHGDGHNGDLHTLEQKDLSTLPHEESHTGGVTPSEENDRFSLPHEESYNGDVHTLEPDDLSTLPHESHSGDVTRFQQNDHYPLPDEGSYNGDVYTLEQSNHSTPPHAENHGGDVAPFRENDHYPLPHEESYNGDVHILEQNNPSGLPDAQNHSSSVTRSKENHHFILPQEENHCRDVATPNKIPHKPYDAPETTKGKEKNSRHPLRPPGGDYWRPSMTDSRAHPYHRGGHRHRHIEGSNHRFRSSRYHLNDSDHSNHERKARSRSPARDIKRGRFRDLSPFRGRTRSRNGFHSLSGSNASHQAEDRSIRHRPGTRTFNGDRYVPLSEPDNHARRSPAPSPGRELTPPRRVRRNRSRSRSPLRTLPESRPSLGLEYIPPIRSSRPLPDQSVTFQSSIRSLNSCRRYGAGSVFEGGHSADMRNSNSPQVSIPTSPKRPEKRRRHEDEWPVQHKRSRRDEQSHNDGHVRGYKAPRSYGPR